DAHEGGAEGVRDGADGERLGEAGHTLEEDVAIAEQANEDALEHVALADDDLTGLLVEDLDEGAFFLHLFGERADGRVHVPSVGGNGRQSRKRPGRLGFRAERLNTAEGRTFR